MKWLAVAAGGALGSIARHGVNHMVHDRWMSTGFPVGTVTVNLVGCLVIGLLSGLLASGHITVRAQWREFVFVGLLGGFTTFSTFGLDTFTLAKSHAFGAAVANVSLQLIGGLAAVAIGYGVAAR
jgi:CrcB protein